MDNAGLFFFLSVVVTAVLSFVAVLVGVASRTKEREAYYRAETMKKVAESGSAAAAIEYLRETERIERRRTRSGLRLMASIFIPVGLGLTIFLWANADPPVVTIIGLIPLLIGVALLAQGFLTPRE